MKKIENELESLRVRMFSAEQEIIKLKSENQELRVHNERILNEIKQLKNSPSLNQTSFRKSSNEGNLFQVMNIDDIGEKSPVQVSKLCGEKPLFFENIRHKLNESSNFNCDSLDIKTVNNTDLNNASNKNEKEKEKEGKIVFKTQTGDKYHIAGCKHLVRSRIKISLQEALKRMMKPCKVCAPDLF